MQLPMSLSATHVHPPQTHTHTHTHTHTRDVAAAAATTTPTQPTLTLLQQQQHTAHHSTHSTATSEARITRLSLVTALNRSQLLLFPLLLPQRRLQQQQRLSNSSRPLLRACLLQHCPLPLLPFRAENCTASTVRYSAAQFVVVVSPLDAVRLVSLVDLSRLDDAQSRPSALDVVHSSAALGLLLQ